jgi:hypothetical protein
VRPEEITVALTASAAQTSWVSYHSFYGPFGGAFYDSSRGYYRKRYKRTLTLNVDDLNVNYVMQAGVIQRDSQVSVACGYTFGAFACPKIYAGYESVRANDGSFSGQWEEIEPFPSYTMTFDSCNSNLPGRPPTTGTLRREYEVLPLTLVNYFYYNYIFTPNGDWTRDQGLDTESASIPCTYLWAFTGRTVLHEPACDLRPRNILWSGRVSVGADVLHGAGANENVRANDSNQPANGGSMLPEFDLSVRILPE